MTLQAVGLITAITQPAEEMRRIVQQVVPEGTVTSAAMAVSQNATPNGTVQVSAGQAFVQGDATTTQGTYYVYNDAAVTGLAVAATTTNPRIDLVVVEILDAQYSGGSNLAQFRVVQGTAAPSPVAPAVPASALVLGEILIPASTSVITDAMITSRRYRSRNVDTQVLVNASGILTVPNASTLTIFTATVVKPTGWVEYDLVYHDNIVTGNENSLAVCRLSITRESPSGVTISEGRTTIKAAATNGVVEFASDSGVLAVDGLTADTTVRARVTHTLGAGDGKIHHRYGVATLYRIR